MGNVLTATPMEVYAGLLAAGVVLEVHEGRVRAKGELSAEHRALIREHADALRELIQIAAGLGPRAELIKDAHGYGFLPAALQVPDEAVEMVITTMKAGGDVQKTFCLLSRDRSGDDVATACVLADQRTECARFRELGGDPFTYETELDLFMAEARRAQP